MRNGTAIDSSREALAPVLFLLPPTTDRIDSLDAVLRGEARPERYLFYGLDYFRIYGCSVTHNLRIPSAGARRLGRAYRRIMRLLGCYGGDLEWLTPIWRQLRRDGLTIVFSDRAIFPLCYLRMTGLVPRKPVIYITMGLPEKLEMFTRDSLRMRVLSEMSRLSLVISLSWTEARELRTRYGFDGNLKFVKAGIDTVYFHPIDVVPDVDVLSIGGDPFRDFKTLFAAANRLQHLKFRVITRRALAATFGDVLPNVEVLTDVPMTDIRTHISRCKFLVLPVVENTYSGATTVLLQAMAMGKAVIANPVASNIGGYNFQDGHNCFFVPPENVESLERAIRLLDENMDICRRIGEAARCHVETKLNLERFHRELFDLALGVCPRIAP